MTMILTIEAKKRQKTNTSKFPLKKRIPQKEDEQSEESSDNDDSMDDGVRKLRDDLYYDDEDQRELMALPETEREAILFERSELLAQQRERSRILGKKPNENRNESNKTRAAKVSKKGDKEKRTALDDLVARREKKVMSRRSEEYRADDSDEDSEQDDEYRDDPAVRARSRKNQLEPQTPRVPQTPAVSQTSAPPKLTLSDVAGAVITRAKLGKWLGQPWWPQVVNLYVRAGLGADPMTGQNVYRMAQIVDAYPGVKQYHLDGIDTKMVLKCSIGNSERDLRIEHVSNQPITEEELQQWLKLMTRANAHIPSKKEFERLKKRKDEAENYVWTNNEIEKQAEMMRKQKFINIPRERIKILAELETAEAEQDDKKIADLKRRLEDLDHSELVMAEMNKKAGKPDLSKLNQKNKSINIVSEGLKATVRANIDLDNDPFSRRPTVPQYGWLSGKKKDENEGDVKDVNIDKKVNGDARIENPGDDMVDLSSIDIDVNNPTTRRTSSRYVDDPLLKKFDNGLKTITYEEYKKRREN
eukprot:TRINITY_DN1374_c0_g1_i1.p2 TRINITY_DN1374_c0_g1~~TRINITY_DN1374_c0_g1_i1.p2  ORF type:complete len:530 (-),score=229.68 TRINITY_DN1374_c0_g1_i1:6-1595(-)